MELPRNSSAVHPIFDIVNKKIAIRFSSCRWSEGRVSVTSCPCGSKVPFSISALARQRQLFSFVPALASFWFPFSAKRNGGALFGTICQVVTFAQEPLYGGWCVRARDNRTKGDGQARTIPFCRNSAALNLQRRTNGKRQAVSRESRYAKRNLCLASELYLHRKSPFVFRFLVHKFSTVSTNKYGKSRNVTPWLKKKMKCHWHGLSPGGEYCENMSGNVEKQVKNAIFADWIM